MKKIGVALLSTAISFTLASTPFAAALSLTYDGTVHKYTGDIIKLKINGVPISTDVPPVIIDNRTLVPARAVFEQLGASVSWDGKKQEVGVTLKSDKILLKINNKTADVNSKEVGMDVPAKIINNRTMIPVRFVSEQLNLKVGWDADNKLVTVDGKREGKGMAILENIECTPQGSSDRVTLHITDYSEYNVFTIDEPNKSRIVVDLQNANVQVKNKISIKTPQIKSVRYSQFEEKVVRVVLDVKDKSHYKVEKQTDKLILNVSPSELSGRGDVDRDDSSSSSVTPTPIATNTPVPTATSTPIPTKIPTPTQTNNQDESTAPLNSDNSGYIDVKYSSDNKEKVSINAESYNGYQITRFTNPDRIAIDIPNAKTSINQHTINTNGKLVKNIRYAMYDDKTARVVLDVNGLVQFNAEIADGKLVVSIEGSVFKNIQYSNSGDRVGFIIKGAKLTDGGENLKKLYSGKYNDDSHRSYTISFPSNQANLDSGIMNINDKYLKNIEITRDAAKNTTSMTFNANDSYIYEVITRSDTGDTAITILKPAAPGEKLVVIDPGHGGVEPGAESFGTMEKNFNLDISKRLNDLLKQQGIRTYIIREDDSYIGLYERAYIANDLNATLFICIHNNAYYSKEKGTETLYFPNRTNASGFSSKRFAEIIQSNIVNSLKTKDRGIVERPNLVVLKATKMPAALAEIAFMTNENDFALLQSAGFRQNAAAALCKSVIQGLSEI